MDTLVDSPDIARHVNDEVIDMITLMMQMDTNSQPLQITMHNAQLLAEEFRNTERSRDIYRLRESDSAIARTLYQLNDAGRVLRRRQAAGKMEVAQLEASIRDLSWTHMMVGVISNIAQGHKALNRGDVIRAYAFYKKGQQVAVQTSNSDERRHTLIKEISELMNNQRKSLSLSLMPESQYNPSRDSDSLPSDAADQLN